MGRAGGREVCFLAEVGPDRRVVNPRVVARGNPHAVIAAARDAAVGEILLHNHPSGLLEPSDADLLVAGRVYEEGLGTAIVDNEARRLYVITEPPRPRVRVSLDVEALDALVAPGGALSVRHPGYEDRPGQREMLRRVARRYNDGGVTIVEGGTGTGKSLAYLLPAVEWALRNGERTIVSTATINLQEQLVGKDLPLVRDLLGEDIRWALVKGRGNYVSIRRARLAAESAAQLFEDDRSDELRGLLEWIDATDDGSRSDLSSLPSDDVWEEVRSDGDICLGARCPHFQGCFYQRSRREAASANLLVVNHHLLFTDLDIRRASRNFTQAAVLPPYRHIVLDEAHNVEDAATTHMGVHWTRNGLFRLLSRLDRRGKGILTAIHDRLKGGGSGPGVEHMTRIEERVRPALDQARARLGAFFDRLEPIVPAEEGRTVRLGGEGGLEPLGDLQTNEAFATLLSALGHLEREIGELRGRLEDGEWGEALEGRVLDLRSVERRVGAARFELRLVFDPEEAGGAVVRWLEGGRARRGGRNVVLAAAPVQPGHLLRESLFTMVDTAVLTSATLTTRGSFAFLRDRLGLAEAPPVDEGPSGSAPEPGFDPDADHGFEPDFDPADRGALLHDPVPARPTQAEPEDEEREIEVEEVVVPSPFDYPRQAMFCVPTGIGEAGSGDAFQRETARITEVLAELTGGGIFVLFTSHAALRRVADLLRERRIEGRWPILVQGDAPRARLLDDFIRSERAILLGTSSFWEGVDVPGRPLRGLILQKIPFRVPTEPVTEARVEAIEAAGGNAFWSFSLPIAALRLKQGFGRLIRSREDRGAILLLDDRIVSRRYGRYLRESLPDAPLVKGTWEDVERALKAFYAAQGVGGAAPRAPVS
ncbi:MAG: helicase C-terminal domain-containing protein [Gemmatimonadota bacterium]